MQRAEKQTVRSCKNHSSPSSSWLPCRDGGSERSKSWSASWNSLIFLLTCSWRNTDTKSFDPWIQELVHAQMRAHGREQQCEHDWVVRMVFWSFLALFMMNNVWWVCFITELNLCCVIVSTLWCRVGAYSSSDFFSVFLEHFSILFSWLISHLFCVLWAAVTSNYFIFLSLAYLTYLMLSYAFYVNVFQQNYI